MKKISLKNLDLEEVEQLTREQLKNVLGGWTGGTDETEASATSSPNVDCECESDRNCSYERGDPTAEEFCRKCCAGELD